MGLLYGLAVFEDMYLLSFSTRTCSSYVRTDAEVYKVSSALLLHRLVFATHEATLRTHKPELFVAAKAAKR